MSTPTCRGCRAPVNWIKTPKGTAMIVNPRRLEEWIAPAHEAQLALGAGGMPLTLITREGQVVKGLRVAAETPGARLVVGYIPHWATCPKAGEFRR